MKSLQEEIDVQKRILDNPNTPPALKSIVKKKIDSLELQAGIKKPAPAKEENVFTPSKKQQEIVDWIEDNYDSDTIVRAKENGRIQPPP